MPEKLKRKLKEQCKKKGWKVDSPRCEKYVYGTIAKLDKND